MFLWLQSNNWKLYKPLTFINLIIKTITYITAGGGGGGEGEGLGTDPEIG